MRRTYIVDGNSLLFRSFYALFRPGMPVMTSSSGVPTNAIYAFRNMMKKIKGELRPGDKIIVCFDSGEKSFRSAKLTSYKMNRKPCEPQLKEQMPIARVLLDAMGIFHCEKGGLEGDDLAGSLTDYAVKQGDEVTLFTSDKDFLQLLQDHVTVSFLRKGMSDIQIFTKDNVKSIMGFRADQVIDYKGLVGDPSDNIPGIKGVGEKTTLKLLDRFDHLEDIFEGVKNDKSKTMQNIVVNKDQAIFCRDIATIIRDADVKSYYDLGDLKDYDYDVLLGFYRKYDLVKFSKELEREETDKMSLFSSEPETEDKPEEDIDYPAVDYFKELGFRPSSIVAYNSSSNPHKGELKGFFLSDGRNTSLLKADNLKNDIDFINYIKANKLLTYNLKNVIICLNKIGIEDEIICEFDLLLATYLLNADVGEKVSDCLLFYKKDISSLLEDKQLAYVTRFIPNQLSTILDSLKKDEEYELFVTVEMPLCYVLTHMEIEGFPIDKKTFSEIGAEYNKTLDEVKDKILSLIGHDINLNSPSQIGFLIYDELKLKKKGRTNSTSIDVLNSLADKHPVIPLIIKYRKYQKLVSSYTDSIDQYIYQDQKIHALFNQAVASTGRLSMSEPNLQNISIRDEVGKEMRKAFFYPDHKFRFLSLDYSQIELRVLASIADIKELIDVFNSDMDIHSATASKVFNVPISKVTSTMRRKAKAVNFGIVYGISAWGLSERIKISPADAETIIKSFYASYPGLDEYEKKTIAFAHSNGYVKTVLNRRRYLPGIDSSNRNVVAFSERAAVNATIQGSAADLIKVAMIKIEKMLKNYKTKMILQIHDELIFKVPEEEIGMIDKKIHDIMVTALPLRCKLEAEGSYGDSWYDCK